MAVSYVVASLIAYTLGLFFCALAYFMSHGTQLALYNETIQHINHPVRSINQRHGIWLALARAVAILSTLAFLVGSCVGVLGFVADASETEKSQRAAPLPSPGEKQEKPTDQKTSGAKSQTEPSVPVIVVGKPSAPTEKNPPREKPQQWPPMWTIIAGLVITGAASVVALCTIGSIRGQAKILAESDRPWLMFKPENPNLWGSSNATVLIKSVPPFTVKWHLINVGRSPAFLTRLILEIKILGINEVPPALSGGGAFNLILSPKSPPEDRHTHDAVCMLTDKQLLDFYDGKLCAWLYGIAEYRDTIRRPHHTKFCCRWFVENGNWAYDPVGPQGWTKYT